MQPRLSLEDPMRQLEALGQIFNSIQLGPRTIQNKYKVIFLDFDGTLAIPWSIYNYWPQIPQLIQTASKQGNVLLCLVSFNPEAEKILIQWGLRDYFVAIRTGTTEFLSKSQQIISILNNELGKLEGMDVAFFDDDALNLYEVYQRFGNTINYFYVNPNYGLDPNIFLTFIQ